MKQFFKIVIIASILICPVACGNHRKPSKNKTAKVPGKTSVTQKESGNFVESNEKEIIRPYKFFDFYHDGTKEDFLREAKKSEIFVLRKNQKSEGLQFESSVKVVNILGADWGLNLQTDSTGTITGVVLITSNTSPNIFERAKTELTPYLGEPYEIDEAEERIKWNPRYKFIHFRHLHSDEGGWTIIFQFYYPKINPEDIEKKEYVLETDL